MYLHPVYWTFTHEFYPILGFSKYEINHLCQVRHKIRPNRLLSVHNGKVTIINDHGKTKTVRVYRLGLSTFFPCDDWQNLTVDHINEDHHDHYIGNLQWLTRGENSSLYQSGKLKKRKVGSKQVFLLDSRNGKRIVAYASCNEASRQLNIPLGHVSRSALSNGYYIANGYFFQYAQSVNLKDEKWVTSEALQTLTNECNIKVSDKGRVFYSHYCKKKGSKVLRQAKYREVKINYRHFRMHHLIYAGFYNKIPPTTATKNEDGNMLVIAHDDSVPLDTDGCYRNFPEDLRLATQSDNMKEFYANKK